jgi:hypothetical protein
LAGTDSTAATPAPELLLELVEPLDPVELLELPELEPDELVELLLPELEPDEPLELLELPESEPDELLELVEEPEVDEPLASPELEELEPPHPASRIATDPNTVSRLALRIIEPPGIGTCPLDVFRLLVVADILSVWEAYCAAPESALAQAFILKPTLFFNRSRNAKIIALGEVVVVLHEQSCGHFALNALRGPRRPGTVKPCQYGPFKAYRTSSNKL